MNSVVIAEQSPTDEELVSQIKLRDQSLSASTSAREAGTLLYERHAKKLLAFLSSRVTRSDLDEVHNEVWGRVWSALPKSFRGGNVRAWIFQIARNYLIDRSRKRKPDLIEAPEVHVDPKEERPENPIIERERKEALSNCFKQLDSISENVVRARLSGETYDVICESLKISSQKAYKLFFAAKDQLTKCVQHVL